MVTPFALNEIDWEEHFRKVEQKALDVATRLCAGRGHENAPCHACAAETFRPRMTVEEARGALDRLTSRGERAISQPKPSEKRSRRRATSSTLSR